MRKQLKLRETIPTPKLKGIFFNLASSEELEYINNDNKKTLNVDYYDIYSKDKCASQYFDREASDILYIDDGDAVYIDDYDFIGINTSYDDIYDDLSKIILSRYKDKWDRLYAVLVEAEYEPLENYNMLQVTTPNLTDAKTLNLTDGRTLNLKDKKTLNLTDERTPDLHTDNKSSVSQDVDSTEQTNRFGFNDNGSTGSPYESKSSNVEANPLNNYTDVDIDETGTDTTTHTGTDTDEHTGTDTSTHTGTDTMTHTGNETLTRSGNIGVTTSQQMLESEIKLRALNNMIKIIYDDIDKVLTNPIYII